MNHSKQTTRPEAVAGEAIFRLDEDLDGTLAGFDSTPDLGRMKEALLRHSGVVWRTLRGLGVDLGAVDDTLQQVFLTFTRRMATVSAGKERGFLLQTAVRVAANYRRGQQRRKEAPSGTLDESELVADTPETLLQAKQRCEALHQLLASMPEELRVVFLLFELEGLSTPEIAELLGVPRGTVMSRLRRARLRFDEQTASLRARLPQGDTP